VKNIKLPFLVSAILLLGLVGVASSATPSLGSHPHTCANPADGCCSCDSGVMTGGGGLCPAGSFLTSNDLQGGNQWCITCSLIQFQASTVPVGTPPPGGENCLFVPFQSPPPAGEAFCAVTGTATIPIEVDVVCANVKTKRK